MQGTMRWRRGAVVAAAVSACAWATPVVHGAPDNWLGASSTTPTWDQTANWDLGAKPGAGDDAIFPTPIPTTAGATIGLGASETANSLTFNDSYTLGTAAGAGDLTLTTNAVSVASGKTASIASQLKGTAGLAVTGGGILALTNTTTATTNNTFSGGINISGGSTVQFSVEAALGTAAGITLNGGTLQSTATTGSVTLNASRIFSIGAGGGTFTTAGSSTNGKYGITGAQLTGSGTFTKTGGGDLQITSNSAFSGTFIIGGLVEASANAALGTGAVNVNIGGELAIGGTTSAMANSVTFNTGAVVSPIGNSTSGITGPITAAGNFTAALRDFNNSANARNLTLGGNITGTGNLTTTAATSGNGTLLVNGSNAGYSGNISVAAGTGVSFGTATSKGSGTLTVTSSTTALGAVGVGFVPASQSALPTIDTNSTGSNGGVFEINVGSFNTTLDLNTLYGSSTSPTGGSAGKWFLGSATAGTYTGFPLGASSDGNYRLGGGGGTLTVTLAALADPSGGGSNNLIVGSTGLNGGGTVVLTANNTFTGTVTINGGVLSVNAVATGGAASPLGAGTSAITVGAATAATAGAATFRYTGGTAATDRGLVMGAAGGAVDVTTAATTLTVGPVSGGPLTKISSGTLTVNNPAAATLAALTNTAGTLNLGAGGTTVTGATTVTAGTLSFGAGANTLTGATTVNGGTLSLGAGTNTVTGATAVNGGTFNLGAGTNTVNGATSVNTGTENALGTTSYNASVTVGVNGAGTLAAPAGAAVSMTGGSANTVTIGQTTGTSTATTTGTLNLSAAASFTANIGAFNIGNIPSTASTGNTIGVVTLPPSSTITATSVLIGDTPNPANTTRTSTLTFGSGSSTLQTPTLTVGGRKSKALLTIASGGTLTINNGVTAGIPQPTTLIVSGQDPGSGTNAVGDVTLTDGTLIGTFGTIVVGDKGTTAGTGSGTATGTFTLGASPANDVTTNGIILARRNGGGGATGTFTMGGGLVKVGTGGITDGASGAGAGVSTSTVNLTGAGVLNMQGNNIGSVANPIDTLTFTNGTLRNLGTLSQALTQNGTSSVLDVLANNTAIAGPYTLTSGTAALAVSRTLSVTGTASISDTIATSIDGASNTGGTLAVTGDLSLATTTDVLNVIVSQVTSAPVTVASYTGTRSGVFDTVQENGLSEGAPTISSPGSGQTMYTYPELSVLYDDNAGTVQVTVTAVPEPATAALLGLAAIGLLHRRRKPAR